VFFPRRIMNQHRWNCLTALFLSTAIAPISSVRAEVTAPAIGSNNDISPSLQSLPTVTPLTVTTSQTVIPHVVKLVPQVSSLPLLTPLGKTQNLTPTTKLKIAKLGTFLATTQRHTPSPVVPTVANQASFSPSFRTAASIVAIPNPIESSPISPKLNSSSTVGTVTPLPHAHKATTDTGSKYFPSPAASQIFVSRSDNAQLATATIPTNSMPVPAEMAINPLGAGGAVTTTMSPAVTNSARDRIPATAVPKVAPLATYPQDRSDTPSFESGLPVFIFEEDRPPQIVATAIAQVGDTIVAPEPSIAIPVERPKQVSIPIQTPATTPAISKIDSPAATVKPVLEKIVSTQTGQASWYGAESGNRTASGERFNPAAMTAAHRTLPFGTMVKVTNLNTGKAVVVRINDRGPFRSRRIVDLSAGAAEIIGLKSHGVGNVRMDILDPQG
jgi:rare lipoprotein A